MRNRPMLSLSQRLAIDYNWWWVPLKVAVDGVWLWMMSECGGDYSKDTLKPLNQVFPCKYTKIDCRSVCVWTKYIKLTWGMSESVALYWHVSFTCCHGGVAGGDEMTWKGGWRGGVSGCWFSFHRPSSCPSRVVWDRDKYCQHCDL